MYLSLLTLNPRNAQVRRELTRPYEMHRTLLRAFPEGGVGISRATEDATGVLFRVDQSGRDHRVTVLVQSRTPPDWSFLIAHRDARGHAYLLQPAESKIVELNLAKGQTLAFRLRANPTKRMGDHARGDKGKRVGIYGEEEQREWLQRKAEASGFSILRASVSREDRIENAEAIYRDGKAHDLKLFSVQFDGVLQVIEPTQVLRTVENGIGSAKGFGFGLFSLAPI